MQFATSFSSLTLHVVNTLKENTLTPSFQILQEADKAPSSRFSLWGDKDVPLSE